MNVKGKVILITGAVGGLGEEIAWTLAANGAKLYLTDLESKLEDGNNLAGSIERRCGVYTRFLPLDITSEDRWRYVTGQVEKDETRIDVLVNNAGINIRKPVEEMSMDEWSTMMSVNTGGVFLGTKYVLPIMRNQGGGCIINTSSVCGLIGHRFTTEAYTASKGAVTLFTKAIAARYGKDGIRCNSIHPSTVDTPLVHEKLNDPQFAAERLGEVPLGRLATPADVANAVLYLASDEASFINGISLPIDGGVTCC